MIRIWNGVKYTLGERRLQKEVKKRYYHDDLFSQLDRTLLTAYIFKNPYKISKNYLENRQAKEVHQYGETPLMTYEKIAREAQLEPTDTLLELGSGRGRGAFFLHHFFKCRVVGIERIPQFVKLSRHLSDKYCRGRVSIICGDMLKEDLPEATAVYLYGTALSDDEITLLVRKLKRYPQATKIISISYPLTDYDEQAFRIEKTFSVSFLWGETEAYIQKVGHHG
ncbi:MAG: rRNA adenine N-6-methyltransferase family protein [Chlamydiota bacterium]